VDVGNVGRFEQLMLSELRAKHSDLLDSIRTTGEITDDSDKALAAFSQFASDLDAATQRLLARGSRLTELLKQPQFSPVPVEEQVVVIFAGTNGYLDKLQLGQVHQFEQDLLTYLRGQHPEVLDSIRTSRELTKDTEATLRSGLDTLAKQFA
jgi:F-type H+-transporting ATPase subunit alpha